MAPQALTRGEERLAWLATVALLLVVLFVTGLALVVTVTPQ